MTTPDEHVPQNIVDRIFTFGAKYVTPKWCQSPDHWTRVVVDYLWVDCPCCLLARGVVIGVLIGLATGYVVGKVL